MAGGRRKPRYPSIVGAATALAASAFACGTSPEAEPTPPSQAPCQILPAPVSMPETLTLALPDAIDPARAPHPSTGAERVVYAHLYETLITRDCLGEVNPGLAESWASRDRGRQWLFKLREGARFWDGSPVTASRVIESWADDRTARLARAAGIHEIDVDGDRELIVDFDQPRGDVPLFFADAAFAVALPESSSAWRLGSGLYRPHGDGTANAVIVRPVGSGELPVLRFRSASASEADARDVLEDAVDVMVTADPNVLEYAASRSQFHQVPLPWDRSYLLLSTTRARELRGGRPVSPLSHLVLDELARDAVRGDARSHRTPAWWDDQDACVDPYRTLTGLPPIATGADDEDRRRIVYLRQDPTARDLAERIAALAAADPHDSPEAASLAAAVPKLLGVAATPRAEGFDAERFEASLREGSDFAYVLSVQTRAADPCLQTVRLVDAVQWSAQVGTGLSSLPLPLVDTRAHLIVRSERVGLTVDWSGTVRVTANRP